MDDLIAFMSARLDEDEAAAKDAPYKLDENWFSLPSEAGPVSAVKHYARHDPARALRQVEDGRRLLAAYAEAREPDPEATPRERALRMAVAEVMRMLVLSRAAVWSDHPDYKPKWAL